LTPERQQELRHRINTRFDQFSLDELRSAESGGMTLESLFPELPMREREFAQKHFNGKIDELRSGRKTEE